MPAKSSTSKTPAAKKRAAARKKATAANRKKRRTAAKTAKTTPRPPQCNFPKGNKFWQVRAKHGVNGYWEHPEDLLNDCLVYFDWVQENPLKAQRLFNGKKGVISGDEDRMRAMTIEGLCVSLGIVKQTWYNYANGERDKAYASRHGAREPDENGIVPPGFMDVCAWVAGVIYSQKLEGAASGHLNPAIIIRELGLKDKVSTELTGKDGGPIQSTGLVKEIPPDADFKEASQLYREFMQSGESY